MSRFLTDGGLLQTLYGYEEVLSGVLAPLGIQFSPVSVSGDVAGPSLYNLPDLTPVTTETVTYAAAGAPVSDTYTGITLRTLLDVAGGVEVTDAKNDILSKFVIATGADGYKAAFSLGEIDPKFGDQPVLVATSDTAGQLGPKGSEGLARMVVPATARVDATCPTWWISTSAAWPSRHRRGRAACPTSSPCPARWPTRRPSRPSPSPP